MMPYFQLCQYQGTKTVQVRLDGQQTADLRSVGNCLGGDILLGVRSSSPVCIRKLRIRAHLDPSDPNAVRERFAQRQLQELWQTTAKVPAIVAATAPATRAGRPALDETVQAAVGDALKWLSRHQDVDGRWNVDSFMLHDRDEPLCDGVGSGMHDVGVTALAVLAFHLDGNTMQRGPHHATLRQAVDWLLTQQNMENGALALMNGGRGIIDHALSMLALSSVAQESDDPRVRSAVQQAAKYLDAHRNPYSVWDYAVRSNDNRNFTTCCCVAALVAARDLGVETNPQALSMAKLWFDQISDPSGRHGYQKQGEISARLPGDHAIRFPPQLGETLTAASTYCRYLLGQTPATHPVMSGAVDLLLTKPPEWDTKRGCIDECYWFFGSLAMFHRGGTHWSSWYKRLQKATLTNQRRDGNFAGSWDPVGAWSEEGGRVCTTALITLSLQTPARVRPVR